MTAATPPTAVTSVPARPSAASRPASASRPPAHPQRGARTPATVAILAVVLIVVLLAAELGRGGPRRADTSRHVATGAHARTTTARHAPRPAPTAAGEAAKSASTAAADTHSTQAAATQATSTQVAPAPRPSRPTSVAAAVGDLLALLSRDEQAGTVDPQATQQLGAALSDALRTSPASDGQPGSAARQLSYVQRQLDELEQRGGVAAAAAAALNRALSVLTEAVAAAGAAAATASSPHYAPPGPGHGGAFVPPGHGGVSPGRARYGDEGEDDGGD